MSGPLGVLQLAGRGGNQLHVFPDCLVRATVSTLGALTGTPTTVPGDPEELLAAHADNRMVRRRDVRQAALTRGRWPTTGLRRLTVTLHSGTVVTYEWPGDNATHAMNDDAYAVEVLTAALSELLEVRL